jgi:5-carboxymethyl-2-hydroxymuconate isomerase
MPHLIVEYSANLENKAEIAPLLQALVETAIATGVFPRAGIRCRAHRCEHYHIADGNPEFAFLHLQAKIGAGRTNDQKETASRAIFQALTDYMQPVYESQGLALSFEMTELPVTLKYNHNNLRDYIGKG